MDVGGGGSSGRTTAMFCAAQQGDTVPRMGEEKKIRNQNLGGWKSATLQKAKEAVLPSSHAPPEGVRI